MKGSRLVVQECEDFLGSREGRRPFMPAFLTRPRRHRWPGMVFKLR
jgi:hypothetical protein